MRKTQNKKEQLIDELFKEIDDPKELFSEAGLFQELKKRLIEKCLEAEMTNHLGYGKSESRPLNSNNFRNGNISKTLKTGNGNLEINVPRDRNSEFEPVPLLSESK